MARPTKLTPFRHARIVELLSDGVPFATACRTVGVSPVDPSKPIPPSAVPNGGGPESREAQSHVAHPSPAPAEFLLWRGKSLLSDFSVATGCHRFCCGSGSTLEIESEK
jgi:hypothetical protein